VMYICNGIILIETERIVEVIRVGGGIIGYHCLIGIEFQVEMMKKLQSCLTF
jgi:hypothetical protein